jgi:hypothetical protein
MHFISLLGGDEWSVSRNGHFNPTERIPGAHKVEGWVIPRARPDAVKKRNISYL